MYAAQILVNALVLGCLYACIAILCPDRPGFASAVRAKRSSVW